MITLNTHTSLTRENRSLKVDLSNDVPDGEYDVLIVLEENSKQKKQPLTFSDHKVVICKGQNFSREDTYGEVCNII
jgi:hypothetical protein